MTFSSEHSEDPARQAPVDHVPAPQPVWAAPVTALQWRETEPLEYHQLLRGVPRYRWWKPLLGLLLGTIYYLTFSVIYTIAVAGFSGAFTDLSVTEESFMELFIPDTQRPLSLVNALGSIALMIPAALLAMLSVGLTPAGRMWSVALRIRWRWIVRTILPAFGAMLVINVLAILFGMLFAVFGGSGEEFTADPPSDFSVSAALWSMLLVLLLVPLQASAEELVFRGALMQAIGSWRNSKWFVIVLAAGVPIGALLLYWTAGIEVLTGQGGSVLIVGSLLFAAAALMRRFTGSPLIAVALPSLLFALAHIYEIWGMLAVASMALVTAWLAWRTGGLEAAITLHVANNLVAFTFMAFAYGGETGQTADGGTLTSLIASIVGMVLFAWWVDRDFSRRDGRRTRVDLVVADARPAVQASPVGGAAA